MISHPLTEHAKRVLEDYGACAADAERLRRIVKAGAADAGDFKWLCDHAQRSLTERSMECTKDVDAFLLRVSELLK